MKKIRPPIKNPGLKISELAERVEQAFRRKFLQTPLLVRSPGRVNLIGEHTDYNEGFVLPAAVDKAIYFALSAHTGNQLHFLAADLGQEYAGSLGAYVKSDLGWPNYLLGVLDQLQKRGCKLQGFACVFGGDIPIGSGLSSSAALEAGLAFALNEMFQLGLDRLELVKLAQKAENEFVGVQCGIMDQFINIFGKAGKVLKLDCRSLGYEYFPFERSDLAIVLCDTQVHRQLANSEYNVRRQQCEEGVRVLQRHTGGVRSLRDISLAMLEAHRTELTPLVYRRCRYVLEENQRLEQACRDLLNNDYHAFGQQMFGSHRGLSDDYQVSCRELDVLVDTAASIPGVLGARMMGAGFGGCTINLVAASCLEEFQARVREGYEKALARTIQIYISRIEGGTEIIH